MKRTNIYFMSTICSLLILFLGACKKDSNKQDSIKKGTYILGITADGSSSEATDYIVQTDNLMSGQISLVGNGIEQKSYRMYDLVGNTLLSITYQGTNIVPGYYLDANGSLTKRNNEFSILSLHARGNVDNNRMIGMNVPRNGNTDATFYEINATEMKVAREIKVNVFNAAKNPNEQAYFNDLKLIGNKVFAPYFHIKNSSFETDYEDAAYIAIYNYPNMTLDKVIKDTRTGTLGAYATNDAISITENGDMYAYSPAGAIASGLPPTNKPSAIVRIKNGTTEFDQSYFFNIEEKTGGYKIQSMKYVGNGKALAQIYSFKEHTAADKWTSRDVKLAVLDLNAKTVTYVDGAPLHTGGLNYKSIVEDGNVYLQVKNAEGVYIYKVDIANAKAIKGAQILGKQIMGFFKIQ